MKCCTNCGGPGPFGRSKTAKDGLKSHCKKCCAEKQRAYTVAHPETWVNWATANAEHLKLKDAARYAADPAAEKVRVQEYRVKNPGKVDLWLRRSNLKKYGITPEDKQALFDKQGGKCVICPTLLVTGRRGMHVDHDHSTGVVRGLLCWHCNVMLGNFKDKADVLQRAVVYLERGLVTGLTHQQRPPEAAVQGSRASNLWYSYGLTEVTFQELLVRQEGVCGICRDPLQPGPGTHVDHDHKLGKRALRGLLCRNCNPGLGHVREDVEVLRAAVRYLGHCSVAV